MTTDADIRELRREALAAGDTFMIEMCDLALSSAPGGWGRLHKAARHLCETVIDDARDADLARAVASDLHDAKEEE
jgi:hypothetical protein